MSSANHRSKAKLGKNAKAIGRLAVYQNQIPNQPVVYNACITLRHRFRFQAQGDTYVGITTGQLMSLLFVSLGSSNYVSLISAFRVVKVCVWSSGSASVEFYDDVPGPTGTRRSVIARDVIGTAFTAGICVRPAGQSSSSKWQNTATTTTASNGCNFFMSCPQYAIVDVVMELQLSNGEPAYVVTYTGGAAVATGMIAQNFLDNQVTTPVLQPHNYYPYESSNM